MHFSFVIDRAISSPAYRELPFLRLAAQESALALPRSSHEFLPELQELREILAMTDRIVAELEVKLFRCEAEKTTFGAGFTEGEPAGTDLALVERHKQVKRDIKSYSAELAYVEAERIKTRESLTQHIISGLAQKGAGLLLLLPVRIAIQELSDFYTPDGGEMLDLEASVTAAVMSEFSGTTAEGAVLDMGPLLRGEERVVLDLTKVPRSYSGHLGDGATLLGFIIFSFAGTIPRQPYRLDVIVGRYAEQFRLYDKEGLWSSGTGIWRHKPPLLSWGEDAVVDLGKQLPAALERARKSDVHTEELREDDLDSMWSDRLTLSQLRKRQAKGKA